MVREAAPVNRRWAAVGVAVTLVGAASAGARAEGERKVDCRYDKCVAITFDDGPGSAIDQLLATLKAHDAQATFFVLGDVSAARPTSLKKIAAAGHEIGTHTWDHEALPTLTDDQIRAELTRSADVIEKITGTRPELMRPPYGSVTKRVLGLLGQREWPVIEWSLDPEDWKDRNADVVYKRVIAGTRPGSIVLLHDIHATTVAAVPRILAELADRGYRFVTVSQLYGRKLVAGQEYYDRHDAYVGPKARPAATPMAAAEPGED